MKKIFSIILLGAAYFSLAVPAFAQGAIDLCPQDTGDSGFQALCFLNPENALPTVLTFIIIIAVVIALIYLIWGGIKWITSGGDKGNVETARNHIIAAIIGLILVFLAWFLINLVLTIFLGREAGGTIQLPTLDGAAGGGGFNQQEFNQQRRQDTRQNQRSQRSAKTRCEQSGKQYVCFSTGECQCR